MLITFETRSRAYWIDNGQVKDFNFLLTEADEEFPVYCDMSAGGEMIHSNVGCEEIELSDKLQKLQNRTARVSANPSFDTDDSLLIWSLGWKILVLKQRNSEKALLVYKSIHDFTSEYL